MPTSADVVIPTIGRQSLAALVAALDRADGSLPGRVILVDDRKDRSTPLPIGHPSSDLTARLRLLPGPGAGPAAARNIGWRASSATWVAFLDDDVVPNAAWVRQLVEDLGSAEGGVGGIQGSVHVPLPSNRPPTDWERNLKGLERAVWITADMAYRRGVLEKVNGFDERFPHAYREDADLALRVLRAGYRIVRGSRSVTHLVRPADRWVSLRLQSGNADDAAMLILHGLRWRREAHVPAGRRPFHFLVTAAALVAAVGVATRRRKLTRVGAWSWLAANAEYAWRRISPGPRTLAEVVTVLMTTPLLGPAATYHWVGGFARALRMRNMGSGTREHGTSAPRGTRDEPLDAVLFDRDGTLVHDVPYNGDPDKVAPIPGARQALDRLRQAGIRVGVISNQSGVGRGLISMEEVDSVNRRIEEILGPIDVWAVCPHAPGAGCPCRKPAPGLIDQAAERLSTHPPRCAVVGDTGGDVEAATAAGAWPVLVPNTITRPEEVRWAPELAADLDAAVDRIMDGRR
jgi:HAD superfamily hydrolase (TIGR01662 family)